MDVNEELKEKMMGVSIAILYSCVETAKELGIEETVLVDKFQGHFTDAMRDSGLTEASKEMVEKLDSEKKNEE